MLLLLCCRCFCIGLRLCVPFRYFFFVTCHLVDLFYLLHPFCYVSTIVYVRCCMHRFKCHSISIEIVYSNMSWNVNFIRLSHASLASEMKMRRKKIRIEAKTKHKQYFRAAVVAFHIFERAHTVAQRTTCLDMMALVSQTLEDINTSINTTNHHRPHHHWKFYVALIFDARNEMSRRERTHTQKKDSRMKWKTKQIKTTPIPSLTINPWEIYSFQSNKNVE